MDQSNNTTLRLFNAYSYIRICYAEYERCALTVSASALYYLMKQITLVPLLTEHPFILAEHDSSDHIHDGN